MKATGVYLRRVPHWRFLPLRSSGKIPLIRDWVNAASNSPEQIADWQAEFPGANIGLATGTASGVFVLDVDPRNGGSAALAALIQKHGPLPRTVQASTPSGGAHYYFKHVPGLTNSAGKIGPGLDIRADGGQVVIPPSTTHAGAYTWVNAPWDTEIAEAPSWLVQTADYRPTPPTPERESFGPANQADLDRAREALDRHGPAIEGQGGDAHTWRAAAILANDHALTDAEAWPLFVEWNAACEPPWGESDLQTKLRGGGKYASKPYGCARVVDSVGLAKRWILEFQQNGGDSFTLLNRVRALRFDDGAKREYVEAELKLATGLSAKAVALPKIEPKPLAPGEILVSVELHRTADAAVRAIEPHVYQRNGVLCEVVTGQRTYIHDLERTRIQDLMSQSAVFVREDPKGGVQRVAAPEPVAAFLHARREHPVRILEAITTAPIFLADGSILSERGYNAQARVYLEPSVTVSVPEFPTLEHARDAVAVFTDLLGDYKLASRADFSAWLAGLLSPLVKSATRNAPTPLVCISAASPGAGKSLLADVVSRIVTGSGAEVRPYNPKDPGEWGKRLTSFVKAASPVSVFDNVEGPFGDEGLNRLITSDTWSDRILGASEAPPMPNVTTWFATGNNIEPVRDTVRRVLMVRVQVDTERPQERTGFKRPLLADYAQEYRSELLGAALTILRAYHLAGRPDQKLAPWGSFPVWSALVRGALVWTGLPDPFLTQQRASADMNEPENEVHDFWLAILEACGPHCTPSEICTKANQQNAYEAVGARELTPHSLPRFLNRFVDKPRAGKRIRRERSKYWIELIQTA